MKLESLLDRCLCYRVIINCDKEPYLKRWYLIRRESCGLFIHKFIRGDEDRALHDHPWNFVIIPLWRGYVEHQDSGRKRRVWPLMISIRKGEFRHRVELVGAKPAWSIFVRFRRRRDWGFWPNKVFVHWKKWWNDLCED